jgi:predicted amidohydrolase
MKAKALLQQPFPVSLLAIDREDRTPKSVSALLDRAALRGSLLVVVPFGFPVLNGRGNVRSWFSRLARKHQMHLVAGYEEKKRRVAAVFSPDGKVVGTAEQTHRLPDESFEPGDAIRPVVTELGVIGLSIGSDLYFPEVHWSLAQQGADFLVHLDVERSASDHFYRVVSPGVRAFDVGLPMLLAAETSRLIKLVHNEEMEISGVPMSGSVIHDQNGAVLASTGFSQGIATAELRFTQHCQSGETTTNMPISRGLDVWKLYFNDSRGKFFGPLRRAAAPIPKPRYTKRKIRIAILSHGYANQIGKKDAPLEALLKEACRCGPDIIVATEMEQECRPDDPKIKRMLARMARTAAAAGSYLLIGGIRAPKPGTPQDRSSHAWLWDRGGKRVFESAIMLYGKGCGQECFDTDFGRIGIRLCGDVYAPELDRLFALQGADIVFNPSMSWGPSGLINTRLNQARAMDNGHFVVSAHLAFSDAGQRSHVIDPTGAVVAASAYYTNSVLIADIDLDAPHGLFLRGERKAVNKNAYLAGYRVPVRHRLLRREELLALRRPELYEGLDTDLPDHPFTTRDRGDGGGPDTASRLTD